MTLEDILKVFKATEEPEVLKLPLELYNPDSTNESFVGLGLYIQMEHESLVFVLEKDIEAFKKEISKFPLKETSVKH